MTMWFLLFGCVHPVPYQTDTQAGGDTTTSDEATNPTWTENTTETTTEIEETTSTDTTAPVPTCDPIIAMTTDMWLEGEMFQAQITCSGEGDLNLSEITVSGVAGLQVEHTGALSWQTNLDSSGRYDLALSVSTPGQPDQISVWPFWVAESTDADNILANPVDYTEEWGIPVVHVTVDSNISQSYTTAEVWFYGDHYDAQIKVRGAASSGYPKNSYTIRFPNTDLNANPVGMGNKDHLVLITSFDDNSYIRQKLVYDTWADMATHANEDRLTPRTFFAVVYINNAYHGLYTACDRIDNHFVEEMGLSNGGNLYKAVSHDANFYLKSNLHAGYEKTEGSPPQGWPHAFDDLDSLVYYAGSSSAETFMDDASEWISVEEFMDWFLLVHYASAGDSAGRFREAGSWTISAPSPRSKRGSSASSGLWWAAPSRGVGGWRDVEMQTDG